MILSRSFVVKGVRNARFFVTEAKPNVASADANKDLYYQKQHAKNEASETSSKEWNNAKPYSAIPGPKPSPIVGNAWRFAFGEFKGLNIAEVYKKLYETYGDIVALKGLPGVQDKVFVFSPEGIEKLYRNEGVWPVRDSLHSIKYYRTVLRKEIFQDLPGLTSAQGEDWFKFRTLVNPILMQPKTTKEYVTKLEKVANDFLRNIDQYTKISPEMPENFEDLINKWAFESVMNLALDKRLGCLDAQPNKEADLLIENTLGVFRQMYKLDVMPSLWKYYNTKDWKIFVKHMDFLTFTFLKHIDEALTRVNNLRSKEDKSIFEKFVDIDRKVAITMVIDMLTAGVDTTSKTLAATLYYLSKNKEPQDKLRKELMQLLPNKDTPLTSQILNEAKYLKAVIKESTRIAPIAVGNLRNIMKDFVLCGYQIPKGVDVVTGNMLLCNSDQYFPRSQEFIPDRFLRSNDGELSSKHIHPFVYMPFGFGPRSCIGKRLANLELEIALAKIIRNFQLEWPHKDMKFSTTLIYGIAEPLKMHVKAVSE